MRPSLPLRFVSYMVSLLLAHSAIAQETNSAHDDPVETSAPDLPVGSVEQWLNNVLHLTVEENSNHVLNRLGTFHLSSAQVQQLIQAAEREESSSKRVVLWHAIRMSQDVHGRDYLIQALVAGSDVASQIQFLDGFRNPTRFDVPILVALYCRHRPPKNDESPRDVNQLPQDQLSNQPTKAASTADSPSRSKSPNGGSSRYGRPNMAFQGNGSKPTQGEPERVSDTKAPSDDQNVSSDSVLDFGDALDVPRKIVDLSCQFVWNRHLFDSSGSLYRDDEYASQESKGKRGVLGRAQGNEAQRAQREMVHWLIRHGFEDRHRILAFEFFVRTFGLSESTTIGAEYGRDLLKGLNNPESRARVVRLLEPWIDSSTFLALSEAEVVRLAAVEAMLRLLINCRKAPAIQVYQDMAGSYTLALTRTLESDPSPEVKAAAKRLLATIAEYDQLDAKEARGELK